MDGNTASGLFGTFARVLVEIDMMLGLQDSIVIVRGNNSFYVEFEYENVSLFCVACHQSGHLSVNCQRFGTNKSHNKGKEVTGKLKGSFGTVGKNLWVS